MFFSGLNIPDLQWLIISLKNNHRKLSCVRPFQYNINDSLNRCHSGAVVSTVVSYLEGPRVQIHWQDGAFLCGIYACVCGFSLGPVCQVNWQTGCRGEQLSLCVSTATDWCPDSQPLTVGIGSSPTTTLNQISGRRWMEIYKQKHMIAKLSFQLGTKSTNVLISRKWKLQESQTDSFICF